MFWLTFLLSTVGFTEYHRSFGHARRLNPEVFTAYTIDSTADISPDLRLITLTHGNQIGSDRTYKTKALRSVQVKSPSLQIARFYTPLPAPPSQSPRHSDQDYTIRLLVRREPDGEVSSYLHRLEAGDEVQLRGYFEEYPFEAPSSSRNDKDFDEVIIIAGGTGVATALQSIGELLKNPKEEEDPQANSESPGESESKKGPTINIFWAVRKTSDWDAAAKPVFFQTHKPVEYELQQSRIKWRNLAYTPLPIPSSGKYDWFKHSKHKKPYDQRFAALGPAEELEVWRAEYPNNINLKYFADEKGPSMAPEILSEALDRADSKGRHPRKLIIVSGPEGFVTYFAGPKSWQKGKLTQGKVAGVLGGLNVKARGWEVCKA
ncbi:MAG: mitochondrial peripheral inner membrane protein [Vezdaea aestivalis]|nr:MAG: mitochondrial peripheral inner membrane protein [Vezdaea aestivalis]